MDDGCFGSPLKVSRCGLHHLYYLLLNLLERKKKKKSKPKSVVWQADDYNWFL